MSVEETIAQEVCEAEFARFLEAMDLHITFDDADDKKSFASQKEKIIRAMRRGHLIVDTNGQPVFTPQMGAREPITFHEPTGATYMAIDKKAAGQDVKKACAMLADLTRTTEDRFGKMAGRDFKICEALLAVFLAG